MIGSSSSAIKTVAATSPRRMNMFILLGDVAATVFIAELLPDCRATVAQQSADSRAMKKIQRQTMDFFPVGRLLPDCCATVAQQLPDSRATLSPSCCPTVALQSGNSSAIKLRDCRATVAQQLPDCCSTPRRLSCPTVALQSCPV